MGLEKFSVELQADLSKFLSNVEAARNSLGTITSKANEIAKQVATTFQQIKLGQNIDVAPVVNNLNQLKEAGLSFGGQFSNSILAAQTALKTLSGLKFPTNISDLLNGVVAVSEKLDTAKIAAGNAGLAKTAETVGKINTALTGGAGLISTLGIFRELLISISTGTEQSANQFVKYATSLQGAVTAFSPLLRSLGEFGRLLDAGLNLLVGNTANLQSFVNVLRQLNQIPVVQNVIGGLIRGIDTLTDKLQGGITSVSNFRNTLTNIPQLLASLQAGFLNLPNTVNKVRSDIDLLSNTFTGAFSNLNQIIPGLNTVTNALAKTGATFVSIAGPMGQVSGLASTLATLFGTTLLAASVALNGVLFLLGKAFSSLGDSLLQFTRDASQAAADSQIQFKFLAAEIRNTESVLGQSQGSLESWRESIEQLSAQTGFTQAELSRTAARFIQLSQDARLTDEQLKALLVTTAQAGLEVKDLDRATKAVSGAFVGETTAIRLLTGANVLVDNISNRLTKTLQSQGKSLQELDAETLKAMRSTEIFRVIQQSGAGNAEGLASAYDNLNLATNKLTGAIERFNVALGSRSQGIFAFLANTSAKFLNSVVDLVPGVLSLAGAITTLTGATLKFLGVALQVVTVVGVLSIGLKALQISLAGNVAGFAAFGNGINKFFTAILGTNTQIRTLGQLVSATFQAIVKGISAGSDIVKSFGAQLTRVGAGIAAIKIGIAGLFTNFLKEGKLALSVFGGVARGSLAVSEGFAILNSTTLLAAARFAGVIAKATAVGLAFNILVSAVNKVFNVYKELTKGQTGIIATFIQQFSLMGLLTTAFEKLGDVIEFGVTTAALGFSTILLGLSVSINFLIKSLKLLVGIFTILPESLGGGFAEDLVKKIEKIEEASDRAVQTSLLAVGELSDQTFEAGLKVAGFADEMETAANKVVLNGQIIAKAVDPKVTEGVAKSIVKIFDAQLEGITSTADLINDKLQEQNILRRQLIDRTITDENQKTAAILRAEQDLIVQTTQLETERLTKGLELIGQRRKFEEQNLLAILGKEAENATKRIEEQQKIVAKSRENEQAILKDVLSRLKEQLDAVRQQQNDRIEAIQAARLRIKEIEAGLASDLESIRLKQLDEDQRQLQLRESIAEQIAATNKKIAEGSLDDAKTQIERIKGLVGQLNLGPEVAEALQQASNIAFAQTQGDVDKIISSLQQSIGEDLPKTTRDAADRLLNALSQTGDPLRLIKENVGEFEATLRRIGEIQGLADQAGFLKQVADSETRIQNAIITTAQEGLKSADNLAEQLRGKIDSLTQQINTSIQNQSFEIDVSTKVDTAQFGGEIEKLKEQAKITPIAFDVDFSDESISTLREKVERAVPIEERTIDLNAQISDASKVKLLKDVADIEIQKQINADFIPNTKELDKKIAELQATPTEIPTEIDANTAEIGGRNVPITGLAPEIVESVGKVLIEAKVDVKIDQTKITQLRNDLQKPINIPLAVPTVDIPGGSLHALNEAAGVINAVLTSDNPVLIDASMSDGVFIPGTGTASYAEAPNAIKNSLQPEDPISVLSKFDDKVFLDGIGYVSQQTASDALLANLTPDAPVEIGVEVNQDDLQRAKDDISEAVEDVTAEVQARNQRNADAFTQAINNANNNAVINKFIETNIEALGTISSAAKIELDSILLSYNQGVSDASSTLGQLISLRKQIQEDKLDALRRVKDDTRREGPATTRVRVAEADIEGGSIHPLPEAGAVINKILTPPDVRSSFSIDPTAAVQKVESTLNSVSGRFSSVINRINTGLGQIKEVNLQTNFDQVASALRRLSDQSVNIPVNLRASNIDIQGGSLHPLTQAADTIKKILTPDNINVGLQALTSPVAGTIQQANNVALKQNTTTTSGPTRTVRVELDVGGERFNVDTDDKGAVETERFAKSLQRNTKSGGEFISPFSRRFTG